MDSDEGLTIKPSLNFESELLSEIRSLQSEIATLRDENETPIRETEKTRKETSRLREENRKISLQLSLLKELRSLNQQEIWTN